MAQPVLEIPLPEPVDPPGEEQSVEAEVSLDEVMERLQYIQEALDAKLAERSSLGEQIDNANEQDKEDLRRRAESVNDDIRQLRKTMESIATGGADASLFSPQEEETEQQSDWREDINLIARPVISSLKELTEKPRRISELNEQIGKLERELLEAEQALEKLNPKLAVTDDEALSKTLARLQQTWELRRDDALESIRVARYEIAELRGDKTLLQTILDVLRQFVVGRGFTLLLALLAGTAVWYGMRFLLDRYRLAIDKNKLESRTRYRLIEYSTHALTVILILLACFVVFYQRGDVLLLGLMIMLLFGLALGARTLLPRYLQEARLLLNIGPLREAERVTYNDLPWRVESINMSTILRNPELHGVLRIPLSELHGYHSRPFNPREPWFPSSRGDVMLLEDGSLLEVLEQNPDSVTLAQRGGQTRSYPTIDFYHLPMINLSRSGRFGVRCIFGVDYDLQAISTTEVPRAFREAVRSTIEHSDLSDFLIELNVEIQAAGSSSIDYWILVSFDSRAARSFDRIRRMVQLACIECCTREGWDIPYQHVSLVYKQPQGQASASSTPGHGTLVASDEG